jgi:hypothetical protein
MTKSTLTAYAIAGALKTIRCPFSVETDVHDVVAQIVRALDLVAIHEHRLPGDAGRIDFYLPVMGLGIEVKVKGNPTEVLMQLQRYALQDEVNALLLVTTRHRLAQTTPGELSGKPIVVASLWRGGL